MFEFLTTLTGLGAYELIGIIGFATYITAFGSVQFGLLDGNQALYSVANILAATLVGISLIKDFNLASALIQGSWIVIGLTGLALRAWKNRSRHRCILTVTLNKETA